MHTIGVGANYQQSETIVLTRWPAMTMPELMAQKSLTAAQRISSQHIDHTIAKGEFLLFVDIVATTWTLRPPTHPYSDNTPRVRTPHPHPSINSSRNGQAPHIPT
jgi:hypothetical protein